MLIDGDPPIELIQKDNATHASIYFTCELQIPKNVQLIGTEVIPEFPFFPILALFVITTLLAVILYRRQLRNRNIGVSMGAHNGFVRGQHILLIKGLREVKISPKPNPNN